MLHKIKNGLILICMNVMVYTSFVCAVWYGKHQRWDKDEPNLSGWINDVAIMRNCYIDLYLDDDNFIPSKLITNGLYMTSRLKSMLESIEYEYALTTTYL